MNDMDTEGPLVRNFELLSRSDGPLVGGKNSSLGEMITALGSEGIAVPPGFATTSIAYWHFVDANCIRGKIDALITQWQDGHISLAEAGHVVRSLFLRHSSWPADTAHAIKASYRELCEKLGVENLSVAVRSSATAEDLPDASFAGQQETFLNVSGERALLDACRRCYASLFTDRAISYRQAKGFDHTTNALSVGVQAMVRSDLGGLGVMFSIDTESGFDKVVLINAAWGLGENVVQDTVNPDEYQVFKPLLSDTSLFPILSKKCGDKDAKMIYGDGHRGTRNVPTSKAERATFVLSDGEILQLAPTDLNKEILRLTSGYDTKPDYFVDKLSRGLASLCATVYLKPAIIRMSDFKSNEYAGLIGGSQFELKEDNPMIGFRGASRYYSPLYKEGFALECRAVKRVREEMGLTNAIVMIPFCRTVGEAKKVLHAMAENGLRRGENGLQVYVMCEIPSNVILASSFTEHFDGFSIGSNDLTQLTLGVDRDSGELAELFDEQDEAVKWMIARVISVAREKGCKIGLCGQAPSDHPEFAKFLVNAGIDSISVSPDSFVAVKRHAVAAERPK
ncbi:hypothetical protein FALCPG4_015100 [Fusarium falciforme]